MSKLEVFAKWNRFYVSFLYRGKTYTRQCDFAGNEYSFIFKGRLYRFV